MRRIPLVRRDGTVAAHALVDDELYEWLNQWTWRLSTDGYVVRRERVTGAWTTVYMHRAVLGLAAGDGTQVDHKRGDQLDNRRSQLRRATHAQNMQNHLGRRDNTSGHRGVSFDRSTGRWKARVTLDGRVHHLGRFETPEAAAEATSDFRALHMPYSADADGVDYARTTVNH